MPGVSAASETVSVLTNLQQLLAAGASPETVSQWVSEALVQHQATTSSHSSPSLHGQQPPPPPNITIVSPSHPRRDRPQGSRNAHIPNAATGQPGEQNDEGNPLGQHTPIHRGRRPHASQKAQSQPQPLRLPTTAATATTTNTNTSGGGQSVLPELKQSMTSIHSEVLEHRIRYNTTTTTNNNNNNNNSTTTLASTSAPAMPCGGVQESPAGLYMSRSHTSAGPLRTTPATGNNNTTTTATTTGNTIAGRRLERNELHDITTMLGSTFSRTTDRYAAYTALRQNIAASPTLSHLPPNNNTTTTTTSTSNTTSHAMNSVRDEPGGRPTTEQSKSNNNNSNNNNSGTGALRLRPLSSPVRPMHALASTTSTHAKPSEPAPMPTHDSAAVADAEDSFSSPLAAQSVTRVRRLNAKDSVTTSDATTTANNNNNNNNTIITVGGGGVYRAESADAALASRRTIHNIEHRGEEADSRAETNATSTHMPYQARQHQLGGFHVKSNEDAHDVEKEHSPNHAAALDDFYIPLAEISIASSARWVPQNQGRASSSLRGSSTTRRRKPQQPPQQQQRHQRRRHRRRRQHQRGHYAGKEHSHRRRGNSISASQTRTASQERRGTAVPSAVHQQPPQTQRSNEGEGEGKAQHAGKPRRAEAGAGASAQDVELGAEQHSRAPMQLPFPSSRRLRGSSVSFSCSLQSNKSSTPSPTMRRRGSAASGGSDRMALHDHAQATHTSDGGQPGRDSPRTASAMRRNEDVVGKGRARDGARHGRTNSGNSGHRTNTNTTSHSGSDESDGDDDDDYYDNDDDEEEDDDDDEECAMSWGEASGLGEDSLAEHCRLRGALSGAEESKSMLEFNLASASGGGASVAHGASLLDLSRSATCGLAATSSSYLVHHAAPGLVGSASATQPMSSQAQTHHVQQRDATSSGGPRAPRTGALRLEEEEEEAAGSENEGKTAAAAAVAAAEAMQEHLVRRVRVMPEFVLDGRCRRATDADAERPKAEREANASSATFPLRFARLVIRDTYVRVPLGWTRAQLEALAIPFIDGLDVDPGTQPVSPHTTSLITRLARQHKESLYVYLCMNILLRYSFAARFRFDLAKLHHFFHEAASYFRPGIPLRNPVHAADTALAAHQWLCYGDIAVHFTDDEIFAFLFTAMMVNVGHSGVDNTVLTQIRHPYATICGYVAPQQGATISLVLALLAREENHFFPAGPTFLGQAQGSHSSPTENGSSSGSSIKRSNTMKSDAGEKRAEAEREDSAYVTSVPRPPSQPPRGGGQAANGSENGSFARSTTTTALMSSAAACEWSAALEGQFLDLFAELTMGLDMRNLNTINEQLARIAQESGSMEQTGPAFYDGRGAGRASALQASPTRRTAAQQYLHTGNHIESHARKVIVLTDAHVRPVLTAILYLVHYPHIFRNRSMYFTCSCLFSAQLYRQSRVQARYMTFRTHRPASATPPADHTQDIHGTNEEEDKEAAMRGAGAEQGTTVERGKAANDEDNEHTTTATNKLPEAQGSGQAGRATAEEELSAELDEMRRFLRGYPAHGIALDVLLVARETLYNPLLAKLKPYLPPSWLTAAEDNYSHLLAQLPTPTMYDCCVGLVLRSGQPSEAFAPSAVLRWVPDEFDYDYVCSHVRAEPYWETNQEAFARRVMRTIVHAANLDM